MAGMGRWLPYQLREMTMAAIRRAEATWSGALTNGSGTVSAMSSGAFAELPVSWAARTESSDGKTSPEELVGRSPRRLLLDGPVRGARPGRDAARAVGGVGRGDVRQARRRLARRVERTDRARLGARRIERATSSPRPRGPATGARSASRSPATWSSASRRRSRAEPAGRPADDYPIVRSRRGFVTVIVSISASDTPASRSRGRNVSVR